MYHIIGSDGKEYGPVSQEELKNWIARGLANAQTQTRLEGTTNWQPLSDFPEFGLAPMAGAPIPGYTAGAGSAPGYAPVSGANALQMVSGPATGLLVTAILGLLANLASLIMNAVGMGIQRQQMSQMPEAWAFMFSGPMAMVSGIVGILFGIVVLLGALKMKKLETYGFALAASLIAAVPCISPCCVLGLPIGIWAVIVLMKPEVKSAFH